MPVTVPCQYRTGKTLGSGTYAIVKEAIHIETGKYYACKVINKKLMEGREHMVRNEIAVLKRISSGHRNIVTLHDYFETSHNLYLCFDLCTGGELFDRICAKGNYYEADAAELVRTIFQSVKYIHSSGIVHRGADLKPENLLFRTQAEDADIMLADFGLSRVMEEGKFSMLTEICGTPGYMAPEIFKKTGHGKPVDVWAMGVVTYFLLAGYTPFDRDSQQLEMEAIIAGDYKFEPSEYWANVSETAKDFVRQCLTVDPKERPTAAEVLEHKWLADTTPHFVPDPTADGAPTDLLPHVKKAFNAKQLWRKAGFSIRAMNRMAALVGSHTEYTQLRDQLQEYKDESAQVRLLPPVPSSKFADHVVWTSTGSFGGAFYFGYFSSGTPLIQRFVQTASITHHHNLAHPSEDDKKLKKADDINVNSDAADDLQSKMAKASLAEKDRKIEKGQDVGP
ncbi:kinase-like domain-containing protein [Lyophyllum atratum]|nr:kinase-like domain-containing protein [Lyophyllum atratum]